MLKFLISFAIFKILWTWETMENRLERLYSRLDSLLYIFIKEI